MLAQPVLVAEAGHPGAALLAGTGEIIAIEEPDHLAFADRLPGLHIGMIDRQIVPGAEGKAVQLAGGEEGGLDQIGKREIGLQGFAVEVVLLPPQLFRVIAPVPGRQGEIAALARDQRLSASRSSSARRRAGSQTSSSRARACRGVPAMESASLKAAKFS